MTTFHSRQPDGSQPSCKHDVTIKVSFAPQIASSICTVGFTNGEKFGANIFKSQCSSSSQICNFMRGHALLLSQTKVFRLAHISPMIARSSARRSRNGHASSRETSGDISRAVTAQVPGNGRAAAAAMPPTVRQDGSQENWRCGRALAAPQLVGQLVSWSRSSRAVVRTVSKAKSRERLAGCSPPDFSHNI